LNELYKEQPVKAAAEGRRGKKAAGETAEAGNLLDQ